MRSPNQPECVQLAAERVEIPKMQDGAERVGGEVAAVGAESQRDEIQRQRRRQRGHGLAGVRVEKLNFLACGGEASSAPSRLNATDTGTSPVSGKAMRRRGCQVAVSQSTSSRRGTVASVRLSGLNASCAFSLSIR